MKSALALVVALLANATAVVDDPEKVHAAWEEPLPIAKRDLNSVRIGYPRIVGSTPGKPFLFRIPASGKSPLSFSAQGLPQGIALDGSTGIVSGAVVKAGEYKASITVSGPTGSATAPLRIVAGADKLALTPPMGWNSWQIYAGKVSADDVRKNAEAAVQSGLASHGYQTICIDDAWEGPRNTVTGEITANEKFPDMKGLADYIHSRGLKIGIYSSPGPMTCQRYVGSYQHEEQDATTFAKWDMDYLKYDLCYLKKIIDVKNLEAMQRPYIIMGDALRKQPRDITYSLCQYGWMDVWRWGKSAGGQLWRTTEDIGDSWGTVQRNGFGENLHAQFAGPGGWNDPDMLVVGRLGPGWGAEVHPTLLTPNEQISHITLWTMDAAPLILGCDLTQMDDWTLDLLCNDEVIAINQDPLGKPATSKSKTGFAEVWSRPLEDGSVAVALFNRGLEPLDVTARWSDIGISGKQIVRNVWSHQDLGTFKDRFTAKLPAHGSILLKLTDGAGPTSLR